MNEPIVNVTGDACGEQPDEAGIVELEELSPGELAAVGGGQTGNNSEL